MSEKLEIISGSGVAVKLEEIPNHRVDALVINTRDAVERFFAIPGVQEDFERWLREYERRKAE